MIDATNVALVFEGGGMRNAYTAGCIDRLLAEDVKFGWVGGISAGATHTVNFLSRSRERNRKSFVELGADPSTGGVKSFLRGTGYFNAEYIYEQIGLPDEALPYDFETFAASDTPLRIAAMNARTGETINWSREDMDTMPKLMKRVRASSTLPGLMPVPEFDGEEYVDGALGESGGLITQAALDDGFEKLLILRTRPRGYERKPPRSPQMIRRLLRNRPVVAEAMITRHERYNASVALIDKLEAEGKAHVFYPDRMKIANTERNFDRLEQAFNYGVVQTLNEWDDWMRFIES
ncbi:patatin family protein [Corynebacterium sp. 320]|uniref:patatin-like phospholipase family protein n=1 Tax=Corynebacterium TaxID=1716 RepID=UPI00125CBEB9|nr:MULTISPECIES: patatin family protein [Corynebacterium]KAB1503997.1 patatin family protein [Corynebacterium sp. 320]KAB1552904.1 patatin family protein [Corynebacterium sp. 321]KAB1553878.1 patatin family protein [Corynebacterium sp. 319]KAB3528133.1 patatin family protein [Corynebacterium sp. 250]KAB3540379.1 patatin family protein [Corynebacterium sp. 366]